LKKEKRNKFIEILLFIILLIIIFLAWWIFFSVSKNSITTDNSLAEINIQGKASIPYFFIALDRSASMENIDSDPNNFESEAIKQVLRTIYWNGKQLHKSTGFYPFLRVVTFSGAPKNLLPNDTWVNIKSESELDKYDKLIDENMHDRNGQFTDINSTVEYIYDLSKKIPAKLGKGKSTRPTSLVIILLTDGGIYPNFLNKINYQDLNDGEEFYKKTKIIAEDVMGENLAKKLFVQIDLNKSFDPIEWSVNNTPYKISRKFKSLYYSLNEKYGIESSKRFNYAKNVVQSQFKEKFENLPNLPVRFNVVAILKGMEKKDDVKYLKEWAKGFGFYYQIEKASNLGLVFSKIMVNYLNSYIESFSITGEKIFGPFSKDIQATQLNILFPEKLSYKDRNRLIEYISPRGKRILDPLNQELNYSSTYNASIEEYKDFYEYPGWSLKVHPITVGNKIIESVKGFFLTFHSYTLDVKQDTTNLVKAGETRYVCRLVNLESGKILGLNDFEEKPKIDVSMLDNISFKPNIKYSLSVKQKGVIIDFINWPSGTYSVKFSLVNGRLKGDKKTLKPRAIIVDIKIGESIWFYNDKGQKIDNLEFNYMDTN